ncbi:hypothetical protein U9M48_030348 [Paspalum notatum var. saurae]|uniref:Uncharacterized protein n=1 Tax=Paspalum notatum var. saurae TaxID=547442 RepID=A0AAQ3U550_PASNO
MATAPLAPEAGGIAAQLAGGIMDPDMVAAILPLRWIGQWWPPGQAATADWAAATPLSLRIGQ